MIWIPRGSPLRILEHLTEPKHFHILWLLYYLFDEKVVCSDMKFHPFIKSLQAGPFVEEAIQKPPYLYRNPKEQNCGNATLINVFQPLHHHHKSLQKTSMLSDC